MSKGVCGLELQLVTASLDCGELVTRVCSSLSEWAGTHRGPHLDVQTADPEAALNALLNERRPLYAEADLTVVINDETPDDVADGILQLLPSLLKDPTQRRTD